MVLLQINNNNNYSSIELYPVKKIKKIRVSGAVHYQRQHPLDNQKQKQVLSMQTSISIMIKSQDKRRQLKKKKKHTKKSTSTVNAYINAKAFHT